MDNLSPRWQKWLQNLGWYAATLVVLIGLLTFTRSPAILLALWVVGLTWGTILAYQMSRMLFVSEPLAVSEEQLKAYLDQTQSYKKRIDEAVKQASAGRRAHLESLVPQISRWTAAIERLVQRLDSLRQDELIRQDLRRVPKAITDLEKRLFSEKDEAIQIQLERTLDNRRKQLAALQELQNVMKRAEIQIESTLSLLGTIYSQILTGESTSDVASYNRLSEDVDREVSQLEDHLAALREVKFGRE